MVTVIGQKVQKKNGRKEFVCDYCGDVFTEYLSNRKMDKRFCSRVCYGKSLKGKKKNTPNWSEGKKLSEETKRKISIALKGRRKPKGFRLGFKFSEDTKKKISLAHRGKITSPQTLFQKGKNHPNWQGGKSFEPYGLEFDNQLRRQIRQRDNKTCQECKYTEKKLGYKLSTHHIDYDKRNNNPNNLISLCKSCHTKTNFTRKNWIDYFKEKLWLGATQ